MKTQLTIILFILIQIVGYTQTNTKLKNSKPNIIFILTDDLGYGDIGVFFQNERQLKADTTEPWTSTPNLDNMGHQGAMLTNHYVAAPVCAPSRASLLSGLSQGHANVRNNQFDKALANNYTIGNVLQIAGYTTAVIGKWGLQGDIRYSKHGDSWPGHPINRGFDYFYGYMRHTDGHEHYPNEGIYRGTKSVYENTTEIKNGLDKCYTGDLWTAAAKHWITTQVREVQKPFFLFLSYDTPHAVLELPTQAYPKSGGLQGGIQWIGKPGNMINTASGEVDSYVHTDYENATYNHDKVKSTPEIAWPETYKRYATAVRRIDDAMGDLTQLLKDLNIEDNTLVVFTSDNGPSRESYLPKGYTANSPEFFDSFGPFDGIKRDILEGGMRVPTIVKWPETIPENVKITTPNIAYDWLATFADAAGFSPPANTDGVSLLPGLTGKGLQRESVIYSEYDVNGTTPDYKDFYEGNRKRTRNQMQLIRKGDYLGLRYDIQDTKSDFEIYNIRKDTHETNNLAIGGGVEDIQLWMKDRVLQIRRPDSAAPRPYDTTLIPAVIRTRLRKGLNYKTYTGFFNWLPKTELLIPKAAGVLKSTTPIKLKKKKHDVFLLEGYIQVPEDGSYTLTCNSTGKFIVKIHDALVIDADYNYTPRKEQSANIHLKHGLHPIKIYLNNPEQQNKPLQLKWSKAETNTPFEMLYYYDK
ncbi:sulfatase-like hydrolase/transferase [Formosa sp. S-31]|uniref:sulfatase-like hydrolase/transferase n=1 Tax=Formosa sp. S-31 TaxID=2790949 RepID=UPI003EB826B2